MSILLILCVLAAAGWLASSLFRRDPTNDPGDSVAAYSRAMAALDPTDAARQPTRRSAPQRRRAPARRTRPAPHRAAARRPVPAQRRRPVKR